MATGTSISAVPRGSAARLRVVAKASRHSSTRRPDGRVRRRRSAKLRGAPAVLGAFAASRGLLLEATRRVAIAVVTPRDGKRRQPRLATDGPELVSWPQLVRRIQGSQVHFDFVCA